MKGHQIDVEAVERALQKMAKLKAWRHSGTLPSSVLDPLRALLELAVDDLSDRSDLALTAALPGALQTAIERIHNPQLRDAAAVYFSVPSDDLLERLGDDWERTTLGGRRLMAGRLLRRDFRGDEEGRLRGIVAGELVAHFAQSDGAGTPEAFRHIDNPEETIRDALRLLYADAPAIGSLADAVLPHRPPLLDTRLELTLSYDRIARSMDCDMRVTYSCQIDRFSAAVINDRVDCERILALCPGIDYATVAGSQASHESLVSELVRNRQVLNVMKTERGATRHRTVPFVLADEHQRDSLLQEYIGDGGMSANVSVVTADLSPFCDESGYVRIIWHRTITLLPPQTFYFWLTDRPTHLTQLRVNASSLVAAGIDDNPSPRIHAFLMATTQPLSLSKHGTLDAEMNSWITSGQGLGIAW